jgi:hypothetical protein
MKKTSIQDCVEHLEDGRHQAAAAALHVLISPSLDGGFVAQGIEIDFAASGASEEEAREHFAVTFCATVQEYLKRGCDLSGLFKSPVPAELRKEYFARAKGDVLICAVGISKSEVAEDSPIPENFGFISSSVPITSIAA